MAPKKKIVKKPANNKNEDSKDIPQSNDQTQTEKTQE